MGVVIHIHKTHRAFTDGLQTVAVDGQTVGECLGALVKRFPDINRMLFSGNGDLLKNIDIYVNQESAYPEELKKPVTCGDIIYLHLLLTGG